MVVNLSPEQDKFVWSLTASGNFIDKSMYIDYMNRHTKYFLKIHLENEGTIEDQDLCVVLPEKGYSNKGQSSEKELAR
jgi:hypothetical protein